MENSVRIPVHTTTLDGDLAVPDGARGIVVFAHGSGSSRHSPRNRFVAGELQEGGFATLLMDLLTPREEAVDVHTAQYRFDIHLLAERLVAATVWLKRQSAMQRLPLGYFGASTGAAAALIAAARLPADTGAVVSRGGRPDLAADVLPSVQAPTLLIVGGHDFAVIRMNEEALARLRPGNRMEIVPGATHLFEEPGALEAVARLALGWFEAHLTAQDVRMRPVA